MTSRNPATLFAALAAEFNRYILEQKSQVERDVLGFPGTEGDRFGQALFSNLAAGGFCTLVVRGRRDWDPLSPYFQAARFAAKRGCRIRRAFLLPLRHLRHDPLLRHQITLDNAAGIQTEVLYVGDLMATLELPLAETMEFGIWDGVVGCIGISGPSGVANVAEWRVTSRAEDLQTLQDIEQLLHEKAPVLELTSESESPDLEEPMITTAPIAHELASVLCQGDHISPEDCSWYHSVWQYLRIFNMVSTPTWHTRFYLDALQELANRNNVRVLISGTADYSMLAHVLWAFRSAEHAPQVTILDLCETPLFLCKWYGKSIGARIETVAADILAYDPGLPFDIVSTDAFLTRFPPNVRNDVLRAWHRLLRPGGAVVTTVRIERGLTRSSIQATPEQADAFRRRALQEARRWQGFLATPPELIANLAQRYAERMTSFSMTSEEEVRELFASNSFDLTEFNLAEVPGEMASTYYARVVACRS